MVSKCICISFWYNRLEVNSSYYLLKLISLNCSLNYFELLCEFYLYVMESPNVDKWNLLVPFPVSFVMILNGHRAKKFRDSRDSFLSLQILPPLWIRMVMRQYKDISTVINPNEIFESASSCSGVRWFLSHDLWHKFALNWKRFRCKSAILFRIRAITLSRKIWDYSTDQNYSDLSWWCSAGLMRSERIILRPRKSRGT